MNGPIFETVEQLGETLVAYWTKTLSSEISPGDTLSRLIASGDDVEMCLSHIEWTVEDHEKVVFAGFPDVDLLGQSITFPDGIDECNDCKLILDLAAAIAKTIGISEDHDYLRESQLTFDLIYMLKRALDYEMLLSINEVKTKLEASGVLFSKEAETGIYRHEDSGITRIEEYINGPGNLEFSTKKISEQGVLDLAAKAFYKTEPRKNWFKKAKLWVVEVDL